MDHSHMHGADMDMDDPHSGHDQPMCNMNMLFTWSTKNLCIVFRSWRITGPLSLLLSLLIIVALGAGYELVRQLARQYETRQSNRLKAFGNGGRQKETVEREGRIIKAAFYAVQVFYSFFIMLLFMTYNGWIMLAVAIGAFVGYLIFGEDSSSTKSAACH